MADPAVAGDHSGKGIKKQLPVGVGEKDFLAGIASAGQMVNRPANSRRRGRAMATVYQPRCSITRPDPILCMIEEGRQRFGGELDLSKTCPPPSPWAKFLTDIAGPNWSGLKNCPGCGKFEILVQFKNEDLCVPCRDTKYPGWKEWWGFNPNFQSFCTGCHQWVDRLVCHMNKADRGFEQLCQPCAEKVYPNWHNEWKIT
jgi:hypothetical protein